MNIIVNEKWLKEREHMSDFQIVAHLRTAVKEPAPDKASLYQKFMEVYDQFHQKRIGTGAKVDGQQGKALNAIIAYITSQSKDKTEDGILISWEFILENWDKLDSFTRMKLRLSDINSNLTNILNQLRNGRKQNGVQAIAEWDGK